MAKTVIGLFDSFGEAQSAVEDLMRFGVRREEISLVARDEHGAAGEREVGSSGAAEGAGAGAVGGSLVGGALGLLVGAGLLVIPGIGPVLAAGPLAAGIGTVAAAAGATALGAGIGAAAGGLLGGLLGAGVPEDEAEAYVEGVRRGGTLLSVQVADVEADDVREILLRNGAVDLGRRSDEWRASGWGPAGRDNSIDVPGSDTPGIPRGDSYSIAGQQAAPSGTSGDYDFKDSGSLAGVDRQVVDTSYTTMDRTGESVKGAGFESGHDQPRDHQPEVFDEFLAQDERNFRTPEDTRTGANLAATGALTGGATPYRGDGFNTIDRNETAGRADTMADVDNPQGDLLSESSRRSTHYAGADEMGGALSNMRAGSGSSQPGRAASTPGGRVRIYDSGARRQEGGPAASDAANDAAIPAHGDFARGMRDAEAPAVEPDFARGMRDGDDVATGIHTGSGADTGAPHHGDFARGMRDEEASPREPDYARGQRGYEQYDQDFMAHHSSLTGAGGRPYDYYRPGYQFGHDLAGNSAYDSWESAERDARQSWERDARGSWEEFKDTIRYGWERARGRR